MFTLDQSLEGEFIPPHTYDYVALSLLKSKLSSDLAAILIQLEINLKEYSYIVDGLRQPLVFI